jgi:DNA-directed RNA polymerase specialized sigma24 family protein
VPAGPHHLPKKEGPAEAGPSRAMLRASRSPQMMLPRDAPDFNPEQQAVRERLVKAGGAYGQAYAALTAARIERDEAIREASALGLTRRDVAALLGISGSMVQQVLDRALRNDKRPASAKGDGP